MRDLYGWSGLRFQARSWALLAAAYAVAAITTGTIAVFYRFDVASAAYPAAALAILGHAFALAALWHLLEAQTGAVFRLGLGNLLPRLRPWVFWGLLANGSAPLIILATSRGDPLTLAPFLLTQLLLALLFGDACLAFSRTLGAAVARRRQVDLRLNALASRHGDQALSRLRTSIALVRGDAPAANPTNNQRQHVIVGLEAKPWMEPPEFLWRAALESGWERARKEYKAYVGRAPQLDNYFYPGAISGSWKTLMLVKNSEPTALASQFPETMALLQSVPRYPWFREAQISLLGPGSRIRPHRDAGNEWITCQLALCIPDPARCGIRVGGIEKRWEEGSCLFFNTSFEHEAWNDCDSVRVVLIIDFLHPGLSDAEAEFWSPQTIEDVPLDFTSAEKSMRLRDETSPESFNTRKSP